MEGATMEATLGGVLAEWTFGNFLWGMVAFFFWFLFIWMFIAIFADIFRRDDLSGWAKAGWIFLICVLPFLGILIYVIARPKMTAQDQKLMAMAQERQHRADGYSAADEIAKLAQLRDAGEISAQQYEELKERALI
jgi:signal transduction histidine kinase